MVPIPAEEDCGIRVGVFFGGLLAATRPVGGHPFPPSRPGEEGDRRGAGLILEPPVHCPLVGSPNLLQLDAPFAQEALVLRAQRGPNLACHPHKEAAQRLQRGQPVMCAARFPAGILRAECAEFFEAAPERCPRLLHPARLVPTP